MQIDGFSYITADQAKNKYGVEVQHNQKNLAGGFLMIIDGTRQKMLFKKAGMVK